MTLSREKLRAVVNLLSDEMQAHAAAHLLTKAAKERGVLIADLIAEALADAPAAPSASEPPSFQDVSEIHPAFGKRINADLYGLRTWVIRETDRAWLAEWPGQSEIWLPKSQCDHCGQDAQGRTILIIPMWLVKKKGLWP